MSKKGTECLGRSPKDTVQGQLSNDVVPDILKMRRRESRPLLQHTEPSAYAGIRILQIKTQDQ